MARRRKWKRLPPPIGLAACLVLAMQPALWGQGKVAFEGRVPSQWLKDERTVRIYLPPTYQTERTRRYPVLYVHDGQNAFSTAGPGAAFGWGSWQLDLSVDELSAAGKMQEIIIVAIDASQHRYQEYRGPAKTSAGDEAAATPPADNTAFDNYSQFLISELKPRIDRDYRTRSEPEHTGVLGSSMGGICSVVLAWNHPDVFGSAASLSGWFAAERRAFLEDVVGRYQGRPKPIRIYLDSGIKDHRGGDDCRNETAALADRLRQIGWQDGENLLYFLDKETLDQDRLVRLGLGAQKRSEAGRSQHNELYWRLRAWRALTFLFPPEANSKSN